MTICISLRSTTQRTCKILVESRNEVDEDSDDFDGDCKEYDVFIDFVRKVQELLPIKTKSLDVYIGYWAGQGGFVFPQEFFDLMAKKKWPVEFDLND